MLAAGRMPCDQTFWLTVGVSALLREYGNKVKRQKNETKQIVCCVLLASKLNLSE